MNGLTFLEWLAREEWEISRVPNNYEVHHLRYKDFDNLKSLVRLFVKNRTIDLDGNKVKWLKIKILRYEKGRPGRILFKSNNKSSKILTSLTRVDAGLLPISEDKSSIS